VSDHQRQAEPDGLDELLRMLQHTSQAWADSTVDERLARVRAAFEAFSEVQPGLAATLDDHAASAMLAEVEAGTAGDEADADLRALRD